jgi:hypothetical protein
MLKKLETSNLISLDSLSLGESIDNKMSVFTNVITSIKTFPDSNYLCTAYLLIEDPEDETNVFFFPLFEDDEKNMQAFLLKTEEDTKVFLDYMVKVSENVKVPKMKEFINEINHEIKIDSDKGKYYKSCKGILEIEKKDEPSEYRSSKWKI